MGQFDQRPGNGCSFYGWWDARLVALPVSQIAATWLLARFHERLHSRLPLIIGVTINLISLAIFKYLNFLLASVKAVSGITLPRACFVCRPNGSRWPRRRLSRRNLLGFLAQLTTRAFRTRRVAEKPPNGRGGNAGATRRQAVVLLLRLEAASKA